MHVEQFRETTGNERGKNKKEKENRKPEMQ